MRKVHLFWVALFACLILCPNGAPAQQTGVPQNVVRTADGKYRPAPGYEWVTKDANDLRVRWYPGQRHSDHPQVIAAEKEGIWRPAPGFKWMNSIPGDLRVVKAGPTEEDIAKAVLKTLGAVALHEASKPQRGDGFVEDIARGLARQGRDELIDSPLHDLFPTSKGVERAAIRNLAVLALEGRLDYDRDRVLAQLRRTNPDMADAVEAAEFLIRLAHAVNESR